MRARMRVLCTALSIASLVLPRGMFAQGLTARERKFESVLRELRSPDWSHTTDSLQVLALRYMGAGVRMTAADSAHALASFIAAAHSGDAFARIRVPYLAMRIPLPEFAPLLEELADSPGDETDREDPDSDRERLPGEFVRDAAKEAYIALAPQWLTLTPLARLGALDRDVAAACLDAATSLRVPCKSMRDALERFRLHMSDSRAARMAVTAFHKAVERASDLGLPKLAVILLTGNDSLLDQATFHVDVEPRLVSSIGDSITVSYTVGVISPASDSLTRFIVDAPAYLHVNLPAKGWGIGHLREPDAASWDHNAKNFGAGQSTPPLSLTSYGLLGVVHFLAQRKEPDSTGFSERFMSGVGFGAIVVQGGGARGFTVGVVPFPSDLSPAGLAKRLAALINQSCDLGWIFDYRDCAGLLANATASPDSLRALLDRLKSLRGAHLSESAYLLLEQNVLYILARLK
jgi:hypothetical protein